MTIFTSKSGRTGRICIAGAAIATMVLMTAGPAMAAGSATTNPTVNAVFGPSSACKQTGTSTPDSSPACVSADLARIDAARTAEGVNPMYLPGNYALLSGAQQQFVVINLERVDRGVPAVLGLTAPINALAASGAQAGTDPGFPRSGLSWGGGIWAAGFPSTLEADYAWMYNDGPGSNNIACTTPTAAGCWGHRDIILANPTGARLVGGAANAFTRTATQYDAELQQPTGAQPALVYSWTTAVAAGAGSPPPSARHHRPAATVKPSPR
jgi:hypothetical protein